MNGGVFNSVTCNKLPKPNGVRYITKDTPLINLVSFEDTNKNDWLYIVLMDAVSILMHSLLYVKFFLYC